jgi:anaerobic magnesium-protoporphyrin IX monomethyl ester cyclase
MSTPRLTLVYPSYSKMLGTNKYYRYGVYAGLGHIPERPHIGLGYLSQYLLDNGYDHDFIDMNLQNSYGEFKKQTKSYAPDVIGLTMVTPGYLKGYKLIKQIRRDFPNVKIIVGGPHVGLVLTKLFKECPEIDVGFVSEAEESLVQYLKDSCSPEHVNGVIFRRGKRTIFNPPVLQPNIDNFHFPRYEKFDLPRYSGIGLYTSRGCPFRCIFCNVESYRRKAVRVRSAQSVLDEIDYWYRKGQRLFPIEDDNFTFDRQRTVNLCATIKRRGYKGISFSLGQGVRADRVDRRLLKQLYNTGFKYITIPAEAGNNKSLFNLRKGETIEQVESAIKNACDLGFEVRVLFVIGAPNDTWKDVEDTFKLALKYPIMYCRYNNLIPIPGTYLFDWVKDNNLFIRPPEIFLNSYDLDYTEPFFETPELSAAERKKAVIISDQINQKLFYRYLTRKFALLGPFKFPFAYIASRRFVQSQLLNHPFVYKTALYLRQRLPR